MMKGTRYFVAIGAATALGACCGTTPPATSPAVAKASAAPETAPPKPAATERPDLVYATIPQLEQKMQSGQLTAAQLAQVFLDRIARIDKAGPTLRAVLEANPDAISIAGQLDAQRHSGSKPAPLLGIPVLLKDNIDTGDRMQTTAGSLALAGPPAAQDATVVRKLRDAGMVILGKANLSEWAYIRSSHGSSGWSAVGGQTRNPYALDRNPCGSSSGSAVAVSAGLVTVAVGTETDGSVICPSSVNGIVGIKPTVGLVSRAGIIPISHVQDTAGAMARTVADAVRLLTAMAGTDPADPATADADQHATDYTRFLDADGLRGKRIGVVRNLPGFDEATDAALDRAVAAMRAAGAVVIDPVTLPHASDFGTAELTALLYEFKHDVNAYLSKRHATGISTLADVIAFNKRFAAKELAWFGQDLFVQAEALGPLTDKAYLDARAKAGRLAGSEGIDAALAAQHLDALVAPATGPAWVTDLVTGDHFNGAGFSPAAVAGYPSITVPAAFVHGLPVGVVFFAGKWSEPALIAIAYGFEQHTRVRARPQFLPTVVAPQ